MDTNGWLVLASTAAWPLVIMLIGLMVLMTQRGPVGRLIDRMKVTKAQATATVAEVELPEQRGRVEQALKHVAEPPANAFLAESPQEYRKVVADLVRESVRMGWQIGAAGRPVPPDLDVDWRETGPVLKVER